MRKFAPVILNEAICEIFNFGYRFDTGFATYRNLVNGKFEYSYVLYDLTTRKVLMYGWKSFTTIENKSIRNILENTKEDTSCLPLIECTADIVENINYLYFQIVNGKSQYIKHNQYE